MSGEPVRFGQAIGRALADAMVADERVILMGEDIAAAGGPFGVTRGLYDQFGDQRVLDFPISEAALVGTALGAALTGYKPVAEIMFMDFCTLAMDALVNQSAKTHFYVRWAKLRATGCAHPAWWRPQRRCSSIRNASRLGLHIFQD